MNTQETLDFEGYNKHRIRKISKIRKRQFSGKEPTWLEATVQKDTVDDDTDYF